MNKTKRPKHASVFRFKSKKDVMTAQNAQQARELLESLREQLPEEVYRAANREIEKSTASVKNWRFIMLQADLNQAVIRHMTKRSKRPILAVNLWAMFLNNLRTDTGEILLTRQEMADQLEQLPRDISSVMSEFAKIKVIRREKRGGRVFYFLNPWVATHLTGEERDNAQDNAPILPFDYADFFEHCFKESKSKKAASDEVIPQTYHNEVASKPKRGKRGLKVIKGGLTSTMENMSSALAVLFPNPFDEAKKALEDMAVKSYAAVMTDPSKAALWALWWITVFVFLAAEIIKIYNIN